MATTTWDQKSGMTSATDVDNLESYAEQAEASKDAAAASATAAAASATAAAASETAADTSETNAAASAAAAATSATSASGSATTATTKAAEASTSATNAATSATAAQTAQTAAETAQTAAENAQTGAETAETNAASSATSAASSESSASTSATSATASQTAAAASATAASASETAAAASEAAAGVSETNAASSASTASTAATTATTKASEASTSASNAATSETNAATSATAAASSASSAQSSADAALAALDNFDDRYLGQKASDPTLDNDGNALVAGALYFNTTDDVMKVYEGSVWVAAYASLSGALLAANNLSDLNNTAAARTNLGLGSAATTASTDYATAAQGALADSAVQPNDSPTFAGLTTTADVSFGDNDKAIFGTGSDLQIYHDGTHSYISDQGAGNLKIIAQEFVVLNAADNEAIIRGFNDGAVELYYDAGKKLATTSTGIDVTGTVTADGLTVDATESYINGRLRLESGANSQDLRFSDTSTTDQNQQLRLSSGSLLVQSQNNAFNAATTRASFASNGDISFYEDTGTTPKFFWDASAENLGIGMSVPEQRLTLDNSGTLISAANVTGTQKGTIQLQNIGATQAAEAIGNAISFSGINSGRRRAMIASYQDGANGNPTGLAFYTYGATSTATDVVSERLRITSTGSVGIGTSSPAEPLHVVGTVRSDVSSTGDFNFTAVSTGGGQYRIYPDDATTANPTWLHQSNSSEDQAWVIGGVERMRLDNSGRVGIGTSSPSDLLDLSSSDPRIRLTNTGSGYCLVRTGGTDASLILDADAGNAAAGSDIIMRIDGSEKMRVDANGNVGIGKAPDSNSRLHVYDGTSSIDDYTVHIEGYTPTLVWQDISTGTSDFSINVDGGSMQFRYGDASTGTQLANEAMRITSSGSVGIGESSPQTLLHVTTDNAFDPADSRATAGIFIQSGGTAGDGNYSAGLTFSKINSTRPFGAIAGVQTSADSDHGGLAFFVHDSSSSVDNLSERLRLTNQGQMAFRDDGTPTGINGDNKSCALNVIKAAGDNCVISGYMGTTVDNRQLLSLYSNEISTNNLQHILDTDGQAYNRTGTWGTISSDARVKQDITPVTSQWDDLKAIELVNYRRKDEVAAEGYDAKKYLGVIAQQAEQVSPALVKSRDPRPEEIAVAPELGELEPDFDRPIYKQYRKGDDIPDGFAIDDYAVDENGDKIVIGYEQKIVAIHDQIKVFKDSILFWKAVGALQEAMARIEQLEAEVAALKS